MANSKICTDPFVLGQRAWQHLRAGWPGEDNPERSLFELTSRQWEVYRAGNDDTGRGHCLCEYAHSRVWDGTYQSNELSLAAAVYEESGGLDGVEVVAVDRQVTAALVAYSKQVQKVPLDGLGLEGASAELVAMLHQVSGAAPAALKRSSVVIDDLQSLEGLVRKISSPKYLANHSQPTGRGDLRPEFFSLHVDEATKQRILTEDIIWLLKAQVEEEVAASIFYGSDARHWRKALRERVDAYERREVILESNQNDTRPN